MKLDYMPVSEAEAELDESAFVEKHWTRVWESRDLKASLKDEVEKREEFKLIDPVLSSLSKGSRILDGGCGLGEWTVYYSLRGYEVVGLDLSRATIERLRARFPEREFKVGDIRKTGFESGRFDAYFSWGTFEHFEEGMTECFQEARRILKPGGFLFVSLPYFNARHQRNERRNPPGPVDRSKMRFYQRRLTESELAGEFETNGFEVIRTDPFNKWHGLRRMLVHDCRIPESSFIRRPIQFALYLVLPKGWVAHMLMGIGKRRPD